MEETGRSVRKGQMAVDLSVVGALVTGVVGLVGGVLLIFTDHGGLYLLASAIAFGLLANAVFRR